MIGRVGEVRGGSAILVMAFIFINVSCEGGDIQSSNPYDSGLVDVGELLDISVEDTALPSTHDVTGETPGPGVRNDIAIEDDVLDALPSSDGSGQACTADADCEQDSNPCTNTRCNDEFECQIEATAGPCDDGNLCTDGDYCAEGACVGGEPVVCADDDNICTTVSLECDPEAGCIVENNSAACDDGDPCTVGDLCSDGVCSAGEQVECPPGSGCIDGDCVEAFVPPIVVNEVDYNQTDGMEGDYIELLNTGAEAVSMDGLVLQLVSGVSGDVYATISLAEVGVLGPGQYLVVGDASVIDGLSASVVTITLPSPIESGVHGVTLTTDTGLVDAVAFGSPIIGIEDGEVAPTDSGAGAVSRCLDGMDTDVNASDFVLKPSSPGAANACALDVCGGDEDCAQDDNICTAASCSLLTGECVSDSVVGGCDDGNACTEDDQCQDGQCVPGPAVQCEDDGNACTTIACIPEEGCQTTWLEGGCDDGNACTTDDACVAGTCTGGTPVACPDDNNVCTSTVCEPSTGCVTTNNANSCSDENPCTVADSCVDGSCVPGLPIECPDDGNSCTVESCSPETGCESTPQEGACDDGNACTVGDVCVNNGCQPGTPLECSDDGNPCSTPVCNPAIGCEFEPVAGECSDGNSCTLNDICVEGQCVGGTESPCDDDGNPCTTETCDPVEGCQFEDNELPCSDNNACTTGDICSGGACVAGGVVECPQGSNPCAVAVCLPTDGCVEQADNEASCSDGNQCTVDVCVDGVCDSTVAVVCPDDNNPCTTEFCDPEDGCQSSNNTSNCDDGNACTEGDVCGGGNCLAGAPVECEDDQNPCTAVSCDPDDGCKVTFVDSDCSDNDVCTLDDTCVDGVCTSGLPVTCTQDNNPCTAHECNAQLGCVPNAIDGSCDDGDPCTTNDICAAGVCEASPVSCADGKACVNGTCVDETTGTVVINEVDYASAGAGSEQFVELLNLGPAPQGLDGVVVLFIDATSGTPYLEVGLSSAGSLDVGQRLVIGTSSLSATLPSGTLFVALPSAIKLAPRVSVSVYRARLSTA